MPKISVIIPFYNVEKYFKRCLVSLFNQTFEDIEYIFVDDRGTDKSFEILNEVLNKYPHRKNQVKILIHPYNKGLGDARITGMKSATGEYLIHCDADDYIESEMYEKLYDRAIMGNYDFVTCYHYVEKGDKKVIKKIKYEATPLECLKRKYQNNQNYDMIWDKLVKHSLIKKYDLYPFPKCNINEDLGFTARLFYYAKTFSLIKEPLYHYCKHEDSLTSRPLSIIQFKMKKNLINNLSEFFKDKDLETYCNYLKFNTKIQIKYLYVGKEREWFELFKECHKDILKFSENPFKVRLLWSFILLNHNLYLFLKKLKALL